MAVHQCSPSNLTMELERICKEEWQRIPKSRCTVYETFNHVVGQGLHRAFCICLYSYCTLPTHTDCSVCQRQENVHAPHYTGTGQRISQLHLEGSEQPLTDLCQCQANESGKNKHLTVNPTKVVLLWQPDQPDLQDWYPRLL
ncbi:hypothetical protein L3Q82_000359 [Scortum barcoo]|uniref:Uncharacterized protein n=1 Tax=Scortum barcoo TaxID=214431 RepID=A0ACB8X8Z0_9TELE|nr:hypothetical protein L3Q82_000359 [Scortum barcoo]